MTELENMLSTSDILNPPEFTIAGVPVTFGNKFQYVPIPGAEPSLISFLTDDAAASEIWEKSKTGITSGGKVPYGGNYKRVDVKWKYETTEDTFEGTLYNLCLIERRYTSKFYTELVFADARIKSIYRKFYGRYNYRRQQSNVQMQISEGAGEGAPATIGIFEDRWVFPVDRYLDWSIDEESGAPFKAIELVDKIAKLVYGKDFGGYVDSGGNFSESVSTATWTDVCPDNLTFSGEAAFQVINRLLLLSRTAMNVFPEKDGKIYCYELAIDIPHEKLESGGSETSGYLPANKYYDTDSGLLYRRDMSRYAPDAYWVYFQKLMEIPLVYKYEKYTGSAYDALFQRMLEDFTLIKSEQSESDSGALEKGILKNEVVAESVSTGGSGNPEDFVASYEPQFPEENGATLQPNLWNVAKLPFALQINWTAPVTGKYKWIFPAGSYIPIQVIMNYIGFPEEYMMQYWYNDKWEDRYWAERMETENKPIAVLKKDDLRTQYLLNAIKEGWWKTFMVHPRLRKYLGEIKMVRTEMENYDYNYSQPSPIWFPFMDVPSAICFQTDDGDFTEPVFSGMDLPDKTVVDILKLDNAPFQASIVDSVLGIISINEYGDMQNVHYGFEPGVFDPDECPKVHPSVEGKEWNRYHKEEKFMLVTLMSARYITPNNIAQNHVIKIPSNSPGSGGINQIICSYEVARYSFTDDMNDTGKIKKTPQNEADLTCVAQAEQNLAEYQYMPWYVGDMIFSGTHNMYPLGNVIIGYEFGEVECKTIIQANIPSPPQSIYPFIDDGKANQETRRRLAHELKLPGGG